MILAANSAFASRSSACGRFRSANTFPELGVYSRLGIFLDLTSRLACVPTSAVAGSDPILAGELRFQTLPSSEKHEERRSRPQVALRTPVDMCRSGRPHEPATPPQRNRAGFW